MAAAGFEQPDESGSFIMVEGSLSSAGWVLVPEPTVSSDERIRWQSISAAQEVAVQREKESRLQAELCRQRVALRELKQTSESFATSVDDDQLAALQVALAFEEASQKRIAERKLQEEAQTAEYIRTLGPIRGREASC